MTKHLCHGMPHEDWDYLFSIVKCGESVMEKYACSDILMHMDAARDLLKITTCHRHQHTRVKVRRNVTIALHLV